MLKGLDKLFKDRGQWTITGGTAWWLHASKAGKTEQMPKPDDLDVIVEKSAYDRIIDGELDSQLQSLGMEHTPGGLKYVEHREGSESGTVKIDMIDSQMRDFSDLNAKTTFIDNFKVSNLNALHTSASAQLKTTSSEVDELSKEKTVRLKKRITFFTTHQAELERKPIEGESSQMPTPPGPPSKKTRRRTED